jgi:hypothetical protein
MKTLWNVLSVIALVNLLGVLGFGGWLWSTGRMDRERFQTLLRAPEPPVEEVPPPPAEEPAVGAVPTTSRIDSGDANRRRDDIARRRLKDEKLQLDRELIEREGRLKADLEAFTAEKAAWEEAMRDTRASKTTEQFQKAVRLLESVPPKQAKDWILGMVAAGNVAEAVEYIDAMSAIKKANLFKSFKGEEENAVATDLLSRLRRKTPDAAADAARRPGATAGAPTNGTNAASSTSGASDPGAAPPAGPQQEPRGDGERPRANAGQPRANEGAAVDPPARGPKAPAERR